MVLQLLPILVSPLRSSAASVLLRPPITNCIDCCAAQEDEEEEEAWGIKPAPGQSLHSPTAEEDLVLWLWGRKSGFDSIRFYRPRILRLFHQQSSSSGGNRRGIGGITIIMAIKCKSRYGDCLANLKTRFSPFVLGLILSPAREEGRKARISRRRTLGS